MTTQTNARRIQQLSRDCASSIYGATAPTPRYAEITARLLFMTAAHESGGFRHRRQIGFSRDSTRGAFGLWQCEQGSIGDSLAMLQRSNRRALQHHCVAWLDRWHGLSDITLHPASLQAILYALQEPRGDPLSCLLARLHYMRDPEPIPEGLPCQARYAKDVFNTEAGSATPMLYFEAYQKYWPG